MTQNLLLVVALLGAVGCSNPTAPTPQPVPTRSVSTLQIVGGEAFLTSTPQPFRLMAVWSDSVTEDVAANGVWGSIPSTGLTIDKGVVTASAPGTFLLTASFGGKSAEKNLTVTAPPPPQPVFAGSSLVELVSPANGTTLSYTPNGQEPELQVQFVYRNESTPGQEVWANACLANETGFIIRSSCNELRISGLSTFARITLRPTIQVFLSSQISRTSRVVVFMTPGKLPRFPSDLRVAEADIRMFGRSEMAWTFNWR